jgi:hypothetical protein
MNRREKTLLDRQLWAVDPTPPSLMGLALVAVFLGGIIIGSVLFARERHTHADTRDVTGTVTIEKPSPETSSEEHGTAE